MMIPRCPQCYQPLRHVRVGTRMSEREAELFDSIKAAGLRGITSHELWILHYVKEKRRAVQQSIIRSHVNQINDLLDETPYRIRSDGQGHWYLRRE